MSIIKTNNLYQSYDGQDILKDITIDIERGEVIALIGPTGSGKTTLLRLLDLLDKPYSGSIYFDGSDVTESEKQRTSARHRMAFVLQKPVVFNMSVYDNIACGLKWRGIPRIEIHRQVTDILDTIEMFDYANRNARTLSGGEMQRVAIARAMVLHPEVLLLDEPTANLDPVSQSKVEELITDIIHKHETAILMATHDMSQGQRLADRIAVLMDGEILQTGDSKQIFNTPQSRRVAEFVGIENAINGTVRSNENETVMIEVKNGAIEAVADFAEGDRVYACIRPEDITLATAKLSSSARNSFYGEVKRIVHSGPLTRIEIDCGFPLVALVTTRSAEDLHIETGNKLYASFKATRIHVIKRKDN